MKRLSLTVELLVLCAAHGSAQEPAPPALQPSAGPLLPGMTTDLFDDLIPKQTGDDLNGKPHIGRFQFIVGPGPRQAYLLDTMTGDVWSEMLLSGVGKPLVVSPSAGPSCRETAARSSVFCIIVDQRRRCRVPLAGRCDFGPAFRYSPANKADRHEDLARR